MIMVECLCHAVSVSRAKISAIVVKPFAGVMNAGSCYNTDFMVRKKHLVYVIFFIVTNLAYNPDTSNSILIQSA